MSEHNSNPNSPHNPEDFSNEVPLGNYSPLPVHKRLGQSFLQFKFIYPLGAVSILSPTALMDDEQSLGQEFESLSTSLNDMGVESNLQRLVDDPSLTPNYTDSNQSTQPIKSSSGQNSTLQAKPDYLNRSKIRPQPVAKDTTGSVLQAKPDSKSSNQLKNTPARSPAISTTDELQASLTRDIHTVSSETVSRLTDQDHSYSLDTSNPKAQGNGTEYPTNFDTANKISNDDSFSNLSPQDTDPDNISPFKISDPPIENSLSKDHGSDITPSLQRQPQVNEDIAVNTINNTIDSTTNVLEINKALNLHTSQTNSNLTTDLIQAKNTQNQQTSGQSDYIDNDNTPKSSTSSTADIDIYSSLDTTGTTISRDVDNSLSADNIAIQNLDNNISNLPKDTIDNLAINRKSDVNTNQTNDFKISSPPSLDGLISRKITRDNLESSSNPFIDNIKSESNPHNNLNNLSDSDRLNSIEEIANNFSPNLNQDDGITPISEQTISRKSDAVQSNDNSIGDVYELPRQTESKSYDLTAINEQTISRKSDTVQSNDNSISNVYESRLDSLATNPNIESDSLVNQKNHQDIASITSGSLDDFTKSPDSNTINRSSIPDNLIDTDSGIGNNAQKSDRLNDGALPAARSVLETSSSSDDIAFTNVDFTNIPNTPNILADNSNRPYSDIQRDSLSSQVPLTSSDTESDLAISDVFDSEVKNANLDIQSKSLPSQQVLNFVDSVKPLEIAGDTQPENNISRQISQNTIQNIEVAAVESSQESPEQVLVQREIQPNQKLGSSDQLSSDNGYSSQQSVSTEVAALKSSQESPEQVLVQREIQPDQKLGSSDQLSSDNSHSSQQSVSTEVTALESSQESPEQFLVQREIQPDKKLNSSGQPSSDSGYDSQQSVGEDSNNVQQNTNHEVDLAMDQPITSKSSEHLEISDADDSIDSQEVELQRKDVLPSENQDKSSIEVAPHQGQLNDSLIQRDLRIEASRTNLTPSTDLSPNIENEGFSNTYSQFTEYLQPQTKPQLQRDLALDENVVRRGQNIDNTENKTKSNIETNIEHPILPNESFETSENIVVNPTDTSIQQKQDIVAESDLGTLTDNKSQIDLVDTNIRSSKEIDLTSNTDAFITGKSFSEQSDLAIQLSVDNSNQNANQQVPDISNESDISNNLNIQNPAVNNLVQLDLDNHSDNNLNDNQDIDLSTNLDVGREILAGVTPDNYPDNTKGDNNIKAQDIQMKSDEYRTSLEVENISSVEVSDQPNNTQLLRFDEQNISDHPDDVLLQTSLQKPQNPQIDHINSNPEIFASSANDLIDNQVVQRQNASNILQEEAFAISDNPKLVSSTTTNEQTDIQSEQYLHQQTTNVGTLEQMEVQRQGDAYLNNELDNALNTSASQNADLNSFSQADKSSLDSTTNPSLNLQNTQGLDNAIQADMSGDYNDNTNTSSINIQKYQDQASSVGSQDTLEKQGQSTPSSKDSFSSLELSSEFNNLATNTIDTNDNQAITLESPSQSQGVNNENKYGVEQPSLNIQAKVVENNPQIEPPSELDNNLSGNSSNNLNNNLSSNLNADSKVIFRDSIEKNQDIADEIPAINTINTNVIDDSITNINNTDIQASSSSQSLDMPTDVKLDTSPNNIPNVQRDSALQTTNNNQIIEEDNSNPATIKEFNESEISRSEKVDVDGYQVSSDRQNAIPQNNSFSLDQNQVFDSYSDEQIISPKYQEQTVVQMLASNSNDHSLELPTAIQNIRQTQSLGNLSPLNQNILNKNAIANSIQQRLSNSKNKIQAKFSNSMASPQLTNIFPDGLTNNLNYPMDHPVDDFINQNGQSTSSAVSSQSPSSFIQKKLDSTEPNSNFDSVNQTIPSGSMPSGWSNLSELLNNYPVQESSNLVANPLNKKASNHSDRSPLADRSPSQTIQRSPAQSFDSELENYLRNGTTINRSINTNRNEKSQNQSGHDSQEDLYITPSGIQTTDPNQDSNQFIQPYRDPSLIQRFEDNANDPLSEVTVSLEDSSNQEEMNEDNFIQNLELIAQEVYGLLKQKIMIERERQGNRYKGRLPW